MERFPPIRYPGNVPGILYEPRAVWSIQRVDTEVLANGRVTFPRNDFLNASKYPIVLTELLLAPVNYEYRDNLDPNPPLNANFYHVDGSSALGVCSILIDAPQRQNYMRRVIPMRAFAGQPRWHPTMRNTNRGALVDDASPSSMFGVTRWDFEHAMAMTRQGTLEIGLSPFGNHQTGAPDPDNLREVLYSILVSEGPPPGSAAPGAFGNFPGNGRVKPRTRLSYTAGFSPLRTSGQGGLGGLDSQQQQVFVKPYPPQATGSPLETTQQWPAAQAFTAREYDRQNANESGSSPITGFGVLIDQIDYDDVTVNQFGYLQTGTPISPLAMRVAARARTRNGGTGEWWWRQGAPLGLVQPSITPSLVYRLPKPITLAPGDTLDVELQTQRPVTIDGTTIEQQYNVGLSFCGFAAIEG